MKIDVGPEMTLLEAHAKCFGDFRFEGRHYVLITKPYVFMAKDERTHYNADAICEDDEADEGGFRIIYNVRWPVYDENLLEYCKARVEKDNMKALEIMNEYGINEETVDIRDWDSPYAVKESMYKYNLDTFSKRYQWD